VLPERTFEVVEGLARSVSWEAHLLLVPHPERERRHVKPPRRPGVSDGRF
jgi:hypothetical protein